MQIWKTVKVFLSSTFLDLELERDQLADVFYRVKQELVSRRLSLIPYDLRWREIPGDIQEQKRYSKWCIEMLLQCQYFIGILGWRYGWRPEQDGHGQPNHKKISITEMEFREALAKLSPQRRFFCIVSDQPDATAQPIQISQEDKESLAALKQYIRQSGETVLEYQTPQQLPTMIYQELQRRLNQEFPPNVVVALEQYTRSQALEENISQKVRGFVGRREYLETIHKFTTGDTSDISQQSAPIATTPDIISTPALQSPTIYHTPPSISKDQQHNASESPEQLYPTSSAAAIAQQVASEHEAPALPPETVPTALRQPAPPLPDHPIPEQQKVDMLLNYLAIVAVAGTGKSALMAKWLQEFREQHPDIPVAAHFMSMSSDSRQLTGVIQHLAQQLAHANILPSPLPDDFVELRTTLRQTLETIRQPVVIALDGLDEIEEDGQDLSWLPRQVSPYVKIVVTIRPVATWDILRQFPKIKVLHLPPLTDQEIATIIQSYVQTHQLQLNASDQQLLGKRAHGNPLYLKVALEEIVESGIAVGQLATSIDRLFEQILQRLQKRYGTKMIEDYLGLLAASRSGLTELELQELLSQEQYQTMRQHIVDEALLAANRALDNFIVQRAGLLTFFHPEFERSVKERMGKGNIRKYHHTLAAYFKSKGYVYHRTLFELAYQYQWGIQPAEVLTLLTDLEFLKAKTQAGMADDLLEDFRRATSDHAEIKIPADCQIKHASGCSVNRRTLDLLRNAIQLDMAFLKRRPASLFQSLWNRCYWYDSPEAAQHYEPAENEIPPWQSIENKIYPLVEAWRQQEESRGLIWIKSLKPLEVNLDTPLLKVLRGHEGWIPSVAISPDGRFFVSASHDQTLRIWNMETGECSKILQGHTNKITRVMFWDAKHLVSAAEDCTIRIWQLDPDRCLTVIPAHSQSIEALAIHPASHLLASGSKDRSIKLWNLQTGASITVLMGHENEVSALAFSPDGHTLISGSADLSIKVWDIAKQECIRTFSHHKRRIYGIAFSPNGRQFAVASRDDTASLWDVATFQVIHTLARHKWGVLSLDFSPDGTKLLTASGDKSIAMWDTTTGQCIKVFRGHERTVSTIKFSPDGKTFVSGSYDRSLRIWNAQSQQCSLALKGHEEWARVAVLSHNGQLVASGSTDKQIYLWESKTGCLKQRLTGHAGWITTITFAPDNTLLASGGGDNTVRLWNIASGQCLHVLQGHTEPILAMQYLPDGKYLLSGSRDKTIRLWDTTTGQCVRVFEGHEGWISSLDYHAEKIVSGSHDTTVRVWNINTGHCLRVIHTCPTSHVSNSEGLQSNHATPSSPTSPLSVGSSVDSFWAASGVPPFSKDVVISNEVVNSASSVGNVMDNDNHIRSVAFTQDGQNIITTTRGQKITIWNALTGQKIRQCNGDVEAHQMSGQWAYYPMILNWDSAVVEEENQTPVAFFSELITAPKIGVSHYITGVSQGAYVYILELCGVK